MRPERLLLMGGLVLATGCYSYVPARMDALQPGQSIRVRLSADAAERLSAMRQSEVRLMEGTLLEAGPEEVTVSTPVSRMDPMTGRRALFQTIEVPVTSIVEVELRERDDLKTGAAVGGLAVVVGVGIAAALAGGEGEGGTDPGPGPQEGWLPLLLRLAVPF